MTPALLSALLAPAWAGYGDVVDGYPSWAERELHVWTNAARVAPEEFAADYEAAGCSFDSFQPNEQVPQDILYFDMGLCEASRFHCDDMNANNHFAHESSDGTSFFDRVSRWYTEGGVGENIAYGYGNGYNTVFSGWMCSSGHRENIMRSSFNELGTGVTGTYYTQDFGGGAPNWTAPVAMGVHSPETAADDASFLVDWSDAEPPAALEVVIDGSPTSLGLLHGAAELGIYGGDASAPEAGGCHEYYFAWTDSQGETGAFPEEGSYLFGDCAGELWTAGHAGGGSSGGGDGGGGADGGGGEPTADFPFSVGADSGAPKLAGCATVPGARGAAGGLGLALLGMLGLLRRRR